MWKSGVFVFCRISKLGGKSGKLVFGFWSFPRFPRGVISTALFISSSSERRDAEGAFVAASVLSFRAHFSFLAKI
jgi:hypothetical protein